MHEVVTLQFGQQASYLGAHYWNAQESYFTYENEESSPVDHDVSFRPGVGADGSDTYTPRALIYDLKGAFGTLRRENALYELQNQPDPIQQNPWGRDAMSLRLPPIEASPYQQALETGSEMPALTTETVRFWSDYNHVFYHPRSIVQLNEYELNSSLMPFERYETGEQLFADLDKEHELMDRDLRPFLEECDHLQAIQVFSTTDDAWGGFTAKYLERIADELGKGCRWVFALQDDKPAARERRMLQVANIAQSINYIKEGSSMYVPVSSVPTKMPSYLKMDSSSRWHTSALQAAVVETISMPARLRHTESARATYDQLETTLNNEGLLPMSAASLSVEDPSKLEDRTQAGGHNDSRITNGLTNGLHDDDESQADFDFLSVLTSTLSGSGRSRTTTQPHSRTLTQVEMLRGSWKTATEISEANMASRDRLSEGPRTTLHQTSLLYPLLASYPSIFHFDTKPGKFAVKATIRTSTDVAQYIRGLAGFARHAHGVEDREALHEGLLTMAEEYEEALDFSDDDEDE